MSTNGKSQGGAPKGNCTVTSFRLLVFTPSIVIDRDLAIRRRLAGTGIRSRPAR